MNILQFGNHCCGCGACVSLCPTKAIKMEVKNGFQYPQVDSRKCIDCSKCVNICAFNANVRDNTLVGTYAVKHNEDIVRENSMSGGMFTALSDFVLQKNGAIYGSKMDGCTRAIHARATTKDERDLFRGSKYIQSELNNTFELIKNDLKNDLWVLFSGTPCQVDSVKRYCKNVDCSKLILVDIICHGVPSPVVWSDYIKHTEKRFKKKVVNINFRDKSKYGWDSHYEMIEFDDGTIRHSNAFASFFYSHFIIRDSCFECPYKSTERIGDITIADCWGVKDHYPEFYDNKGVSLVLVNNSKGLAVFEECKESIDKLQIDINKVLQPPLVKNWDKPENYEEFWQYYGKHSFGDSIDKYLYKIAPVKPFVRMLRKGTNLVKDIIKRWCGRK